jgi:serine/threonine protein phosphatase PrpC
VAVIDDDNKLDMAWIGDSQIMVVRNGEALLQTAVMTHSFNYPFQLGFGSTDTPQDSMQTRVELQPGDVVVAATDGLWDNVHLDEILTILQEPRGALKPCVSHGYEYEDRGGDVRQHAYEYAVNLAHRAFELSLDPSWRSPFAVESCLELQAADFIGGKPDDITVVVAEVVESRGAQGTASWCHTHYSNICERRGGGLGWEDN